MDRHARRRHCREREDTTKAGLETGFARLKAQLQTIAQHELAESKNDRPLVLADLAWLCMTYEPAQSQVWAKEALALQLANRPRNDTGINEAYSVLANAYYTVGDAAPLADTNAHTDFCMCG